jgi:hypothetical protein
MTGASFERIDYQLRNNKHIERRLMFDRLARASSLVEFSSYRYLGFGSMWFVDFRLAHRVLGIAEMASMERIEHADRALFNRPFRCIDVLAGDSGVILASTKSEDWQKPVVCWLDYDGVLDPTVVEDIGTLLDHAVPGSVIAVSINANYFNYRPKNVQGQRERRDTALGQVEVMLQASVVAPRFERPVTGGGNHGDVEQENFPEFLAIAILSWMIHRIDKAKRKPAWADHTDDGEILEFLPLFNYCHKDGVDMVTVGGAIVDSRCHSVWKDKVGEGIEWSPLDPGLPVHERLDLIPLTIKEKLVLDTCLPHDYPDFMDGAKASGLKIADEHLTKYWRYYKQFPLFFETSV